MSTIRENGHSLHLKSQNPSSRPESVHPGILTVRHENWQRTSRRDVCKSSGTAEPNDAERSRVRFSAPHVTSARLSVLLLYEILVFSRPCSTSTYDISGDTRWCNWLSHRATIRKVAGSITDGVSEIYHWFNPFRPPYGPWDDAATKRNECPDYPLGRKGDRFDRLEILKASTSRSPKGLPRHVYRERYFCP